MEDLVQARLGLQLCFQWIRLPWLPKMTYATDIRPVSYSFPQRIKDEQGHYRYAYDRSCDSQKSNSLVSCGLRP
jgi:hypothetical protein